MAAPGFTPTQLAARAAYLLRGNDLGTMTSAAPRLYPHMWSWDAAFVSVGLAPLSVERAVVELDTLLSAQWSNGMIPHIVFASGVDGYFPGPARWQVSDLAAHAPIGVHTSGITQPPVHAIAVQRVLDHARRRGRTTRQVAGEFLDRRWPDLVRWHRWLAHARDQDGTGRITLHHGWESGMDNSPRWDKAYSKVIPGVVPPYLREDTSIVTDSSQRPSDVEYDRYLWLLEEMKLANYDDVAMHAGMSFAVEDVFVSAIFAVACDVLATIGEDHSRPHADVRELRGWADHFRAGVVATTDPRSGAARDRDVRSGEWIKTDTMAMFAPLLCGGLPRDTERALLRLFEGPRFCGHPDFAYAVPPSTSPISRDFRAREYWRGPVWPVITWLFSWAFARRGWSERSAMLREEGLRQAGDGSFAEYYEPFTGEPLGSMQQSWTAASVLDWLG
ncbi:glycogen debranching protein [Rhodococcus sp. Leaf7]|uniref:glucosylglycerate hydrolase n=1 Tax=unclassified Rhodococcus (in: high G+C Gram-positive bacteria) TaxID=192944 RepID=UPI0005ACAF73|nr:MULTISPECIES: glycogen debranching protein [unclassified Rhodococcus (in: high G+C Gram-positive bacteria)]KIQ19330.1 glycogen debranching protein [Rhodococcus sp. MEB064]KQU04554.1 glycogen debranching protein [Rhodococcus sp. Leaf7]KQU40740.1 glycogen debranching protein [Rhodococcus sp. Leaf247]